MKLACVTPSCVHTEVRFPLDQRILCSGCCEKIYYGLWLAQIFFSYFVLHRSKIPLVLTTKVTHLRSLLFRQQDGVLLSEQQTAQMCFNSVVRTYY